MNILGRALLRNRGRVASGGLLSGVHQGCEALVPVLIGVIVDRAVATRDLTMLILWVCALGALFLVLTIAYRTGNRQLMRAIADEAHRLRLEVAAKVLDPRTEVRTGDVLTISATDADTTSYLLDYLPRLAGALVATAISATGLFVISVPLGLVVLIGTPVVLVGLQRAAPRIIRRVADRQEVAGRAASLATDLVTGLRPLRGIGAQDAAARRYREVSRESLGATLRAAKTLGWFQAASDTVSTLVACGIALLAGWFALTGRISAGELVTVIGLAAFLGEPFATLSAAPGWLASSRASAERIQALLDLVPAERPTGRNPLSPVRGECVGVVAEPDAAALVALLDDGSPDVLVAPHLPELFSGTIRENLIDATGDERSGVREPGADDVTAAVWRGSGADGAAGAVWRGSGADGAAGAGLPGSGADDLVAAVLRASAADDVVAAHPDGLDHAIADRGAALSGGQRQRLALARALLARPRLLVLHEPTTAVDAVTEHAIARGIRDLRHGPGSTLGTVLVTTSPALLAVTDRVVVLRDGEVVATGTHAVLAATDETYRTAVLR